MPPMNALDSASFPNSGASSNYQQQKYNPSVGADYNKVAPTFSRYRRRSSVTRYSLDEQTDNVVNSASTCTIQNYVACEPEDITIDTPPSPHKRYGQRCSVTRFSVQQGDTKTIPEMRSLSPLPIARRGSVTTYTGVGAEAFAPSKEQETLKEEQPERPAPAPRRRYGRRCSVTKYSLDAAEVVAKTTVARPRYQRRCSVTKFSLPTIVSTNDIDNVSSISLTDAEPADTVDSLEHREMLANDTIESSGAGDLTFIGWNKAKAATALETSTALNGAEDENVAVGELICGFESRRFMILKMEQEEEEKQWSPPPSPSEKRGYFLGVLSKRFSMTPSWVKTSLESEVPAMRSSISTPPSA